MQGVLVSSATPCSPFRGLLGSGCLCTALLGYGHIGTRSSLAPRHCSKALPPQAMAPSHRTASHPSAALPHRAAGIGRRGKETGSSERRARCHFSAAPVARYYYCPHYNQSVLFLETRREQRRFGERKRCFTCQAGRFSTMFVAFVQFWAKAGSFK